MREPDRNRLMAIVDRIIRCDGSDREVDELIREFCAAVPHPEALNVLGASDSPEEIVEIALSYRPILL
jgi:hypothetical protein